MNEHQSDVRAGVIAGLMAGVAYLAEMAIDLRAARYNTDDVHLLGRMATADKRWVRPIGVGMHLGNSAIFGVAYALLAHDRLPGPPWLRGVTVANVENAALFSLARFEQHHPGIRNGDLDSYRSMTAFTQNIARHVVFGAVLGGAYARLRGARLATRPR